MSEALHIVATITPAEGKMERLKSLLTYLVDNVQAQGTNISRFELFEQVNSATGKNVIVAQETYKDRAAFEAHTKTDYFQTVEKALKEENVLAEPLEVKFIKPLAGFAAR